MNPRNLLTTLALVLVVLFTGCKKDDFVENAGVCPLVLSTDPANLAVDVPLAKVITATFNEVMNEATITSTSFTVEALAKGAMVAEGTVAYNALTASFTPSVALAPNTTYTGTIKSSVRDLLGNSLQVNYVWTFTTIPQITVSSVPAAGGTATGSGTFAQGSVVTVVATPNAGYAFTNWTDAGTVVSTSSSYQFTVAGNRTLAANFTVVAAGNFAVNLSSSPVAGGTTSGAGSFSSGSSVTVTALPNPLYSFVNWTDAGIIVSTSSSYTFSLNTNRTLVANYNLIPASQFAVILSSNPPSFGTTEGSGSFNAASSVTVTATPNTGYNFVNWTDAGTVVSTSAAYTFTLNANKTLVANFAINTYALNLTAVNGTVVKNPNQLTYNHGTTVELTATPDAGYTFTSWSGDAVGSTNPLTVTMDAVKNITANFSLNSYALNVTAVNGVVVKNPDQVIYNHGTSVQLTATADASYQFISWSGDATGSVNPLNVTMNSVKNITANFTPILGPGAVDLGTAANFAALAKTGISTTGVTSIIGDIGVSPAAATFITGFGLIMDATGTFSTSSLVTGNIYASDYTPPTPTYISTAISDLETAFTTANGMTTSVINDAGAGNISGMTLVPGLYKWSTGVLISNVGVTLAGGPEDTWVFQIAQDLTVANSAIITLTGGAQAKNIFWVTATQAVLGSNVDFSGNILSQTLTSLNTGATVHGRLLAQSAVTLNAGTVIKPN
jgi:uncharacterized repeat protein (TIGR02543 family)